MARIAGINIPTNKHIVIALQSIFGIGQTRAKLICETLKLEPSTKVSELTEDQLESIRTSVTQFEVEGDLRREVAMNIVASPNKMNILSSTFQTVAETELLFNVKPTSFLPPPKVYSSVIKLIFKDHPLVEKSELDDFFNFVVAAFAAPRKQIKNSLSLIFG